MTNIDESITSIEKLLTELKNRVTQIDKVVEGEVEKLSLNDYTEPEKAELKFYLKSKYLETLYEKMNKLEDSKRNLEYLKNRYDRFLNASI